MAPATVTQIEEHKAKRKRRPRRREGSTQASAADEANGACALPASLRTEVQLQYEEARYPFADLISELLDGCGTALDQMHTMPESQEWLQGCLGNDARAYAMRRNNVDKKFKQANGFRSGGALTQCYHRFLREVVAPELEAAVPGASAATMLFQREPNFRCHLPGTGHLLVHQHCDSDYHHQPNEVNIWVPLTSAFASNTLWAESAPGAGDFRPFELNPGECMRFWGHQCSHYTVPNETSHTRVSIDFRVIPWRDLYRESYPRSHRSDGLQRFADGAYFATFDELQPEAEHEHEAHRRVHESEAEAWAEAEREKQDPSARDGIAVAQDAAEPALALW